MKFLCDRCKTRYTIADERVRGKILKIRCKNCANVISVREGQPEPADNDANDASGARPAPRPTLNSTGRLVSNTNPPRNTGSVSSTMPSAPPVVDDEEWYVSIDGEQTGPLTLAQAKAWVGGRAVGDELYCWSEGFDEWLSVEKVNHFRGLRAGKGGRGGRPATQPPPIPAEPAPKPLFAATMAAVEASAASGSAAGAARSSKPRALTPPPTPPGGRALTPPPVATGASPADRFDAGGDVAATPAFAAAVLAKGASNGATGPTTDAATSGGGGGDDDLSIGEVSRVVRIADLAKQQMRPSGSADAAVPAARRTATAPALARGATGNGAMPAIATVTVPGGAEVGRAPPRETGGDLLVQSTGRRSHGVYWLAGIVLVGLVAAIVSVVVSQSGGGDADVGGGGGGDYDELGYRIDDPRRPNRGNSTATGSGSAAQTGGGRRPIGGSNPNRGGNTGSGTNSGSGAGSGSAGRVEVGPGGDLASLTSEDVELMSRQNSFGTTRCWEQAQKRDLFIEAKRIKVTLTVDKGGQVKQVSLSAFANEFLGQCLVTAVKRWRFKPSLDGITAQFTLAFSKT